MKKKIKIANILEEARVGGPQVRLLLLAKALRNKVNFTAILPKKNSSNLIKKCKKFNVNYILSNLSNLSRSPLDIISYIVLFPFEIIMLISVFKKNKFDLVHVSGGAWQYKGVIAAKLSGIKVIWELNDSYAPFIIRFTFNYLNFFADSFIYGSKNTEKYYKKLISKNKKNFLIQSPVDTNYFNPSITYPAKNFFNNNKNKVVVGTVANINPIKGLDTFLLSAKELLYYQKNIIFIVVGDAHQTQKKYYNQLINLKKKLNIRNFFFLGKQEDVRPFIKFIDIYVCSSISESSPLSVWEAMSMKKAIVSTDVGDVKKFIKNGKNGFVVNVNDTNIMAKKIKFLIHEPKLRNLFGKRSRIVAKNNFDIKLFSKKHFMAYRKIVNLRTNYKKV